MLNQRRSTKLIPFFAVFTFALTFISLYCANTIKSFYNIDVNGGMLTFPLTFAIYDFMAEFYGYKIARTTIFTNLLLTLLYSLFLIFFMKLPVGSTTVNQVDDFTNVTTNFIRASLAYVASGSIAITLNNYIFSRVKVIMRGKGLLFRLVIITSMAEFIYSVLWISIDLGHILSLKMLMHFAGMNFLIKILFQVIAYYPIRITIGVLKRYDDLKTCEPNYKHGAF